MSYNYIFQKKLLHMKTKGSVYNMHHFCENSPRKLVCVIYTGCFVSYEVIFITRQKYKVEQLPVLWNTENKSRQNVCLASSMSIWSVTQLEVESHRSTITIENHLHFFEYFDDKIIYMKFSFRFWKGSIYPLIFWVFCTNAERFQWEKIMHASILCHFESWVKYVSGSPQS